MMEKQLAKYRQDLKTQNVFYLVLAAIVLVFIVLSLTEVIQPAVNNERWADAWNGFI